jgi:hypothetical protein
MAPLTLFILLMLVDTTKGTQWHPVPTGPFETKSACEEQGSILVETLGGSGKGPAVDWKCVKYHAS